MTSPTPGDGRFVTSDAVAARFDGTFPSNRVTWLKWRILDFENELLGQVPSLRALNPAAIDAIGDPTDPLVIRLGRVRSLIIEKVLDLFENTKKAGSYTQSMDGVSETWNYMRAGAPGIAFTDEELNRVRPPRPRRPRIGTFGASPWGV